MLTHPCPCPPLSAAGKYDYSAEGNRKAMKIKAGDKVLYFKYAGENMETPRGDKYVMLREDDILCKA